MADTENDRRYVKGCCAEEGEEGLSPPHATEMTARNKIAHSCLRMIHFLVLSAQFSDPRVIKPVTTIVATTVASDCKMKRPAIGPPAVTY
jgi:hypothetical protein